MAKLRKIVFTKVNGAGNDFVVIDTRKAAMRGVRWPVLAPAWCNRQRGIGADGVLLLEPSRRADLAMRIINADGSEAEMCGNGARCVVRYLHSRQPRLQRVCLDTKAGILEAHVSSRSIKIQMPKPKDLRLGVTVKVHEKTYHGGFVNTGVPHFVVPVEDIRSFDVYHTGRALRWHADFAPRGTNVNFIGPHERVAGRIHVRTYERGVEAETLACGTGVTASAIIASLLKADARGRARQRFRVTTEPTSGEVIKIAFTAGWQPEGLSIEDVVMEGGAQIVFEGKIAL
jgi:diaminopimelate epimerase